MYDTVKDELYCPYCGEKAGPDDFQTKDLACMLDSWSISEIIKFGGEDENHYTVNIYHHCKNCGKWIDINIGCNKESDSLKLAILTKLKHNKEGSALRKGLKQRLKTLRGEKWKERLEDKYKNGIQKGK